MGIEEKYWVQVAYHRRTPEQEKTVREANAAIAAGRAQIRNASSGWPVPSQDAEAISEELTGASQLPDELVPAPPPPVPPAPGSYPGAPVDKIRVLTKEQEDAELAGMRATDNPRVRRIFDILDAPSKGQKVPDGVRLNQGDLVAPGLILEERPFPEWFHALMDSNGWEYDKGSASFMICVSGKPAAEKWYAWVTEVMVREAEYARSVGTMPLAERTGIYIREDHRDLFNAEMSNFG